MKKDAERKKDKELVRKVKAGDYAAFEELVCRFQARIFSHCYRMLRNYQDAQDCLQETFLKAYEKLDTYREEASFSVWLYRVATNNCFMKIRKKRSRVKEIHLDDLLGRAEEDFTVEIPDHRADPEKMAINEELKEKMEEAVAELPDDYRATFLLRDMEGFSTRETAEILNITEANVKSRLHRARLLLRKLLLPYIKPAAAA